MGSPGDDDEMGFLPSATRGEGDSVTPSEAITFLGQAGAKVSDPKKQAEVERNRAAFDAAQAAAAADALENPATTAAKAEGGMFANDVDLLDAKRKDEATRAAADLAANMGCALSRGTILAIGVGVVLIIAVLVLFLGNDSNERGTASHDQPSTKPAATGGDGGAGGDGGLAGHWTLSTGLTDETGLDEFDVVGPDFQGSLRLGPRSASFDIAEDLSVVGGEYHTAHTRTDSVPCTVNAKLDGSSATGAFQKEGFGNVTWAVTQTYSDSCRHSTGTTPLQWQMYFFLNDDGSMTACRLLPSGVFPTTKSTACAGGAKGTAGTFRRG